MAARLPVPRQDHGNWGSLLNDYLLVAHTDSGELRPASVGTSALQDGAVTVSKLEPSLRTALQAHTNTVSTRKTAAGDTLLLAGEPDAKVAATVAPKAASIIEAPPLIFSPEDYGCARYASSSVNDAAIAAAIEAASAVNGTVLFTGKGPYAIANAIVQDVTKFVVKGNKTVLNVDDSFAGDVFWMVYTSANYPYTYNQGPAIDGVILQGMPLDGASPMKAAGIQIGNEAFFNNSLFTITHVCIQGFAIGFKYVKNTWRVKVSNCRVTGGIAFYAPPNLDNFGENMLIENCMIESYGPTINLASGEWNFINCSLDYTLTTINGNCVVRFLGCHFEPHTVFPFIDITHAQATVIIDDCSMIIDPKISITKSPFNITKTNVSYGLIIRNLDTIHSSNFNPQVTNVDALLVSGGGRVDMQGFAANITGFGFVISETLNRIYNGGGEKGTTAGWTTYANYGGPSVFTVDTTQSKSGNNSLKLTVNASSIYVGQAVPCQPGKWLMAQCYNKLDIASGTANTFVDIDFLSAKGDVILTTGYTNTTTTTDWTFKRLAGTSCIAPPGTASARVYIGLVGSSIATAWYDNVIINIV